MTPRKGSRGLDKKFITVMLNYRYWLVMAYSKELSDIIVWGQCEEYSSKKLIWPLH